ncbi:Acid-sensing ion channel 1B [Dirofilaria immitis]
MMNSSHSEIQFLQNLQNHPDFRSSPLLSNKCPNLSTLITESPVTCPLKNQSLELNIQIPQLAYYYQQPTIAKDRRYSSKESKTVQTQTSPTSEIAMVIQLNPYTQQENLHKQFHFDFNLLETQHPPISVHDRFLNKDEEDHKGKQNRHLSDIELLRQIYNELRYKISQADFVVSSQNQKMTNKTKINKGINWKECFLGERMRRWGLWFVVTFLAIMTIRDIALLVIQYIEYPKQSNMNIVFNESMRMPNITFCMTRQQAWSHFILNNSEMVDEWDRKIQIKLKRLDTREKFLNEAWNYRLVVEAYETIATLSSMERETTAQGSIRSINFFRTHPKLRTKRAMVKTWLNEIKHLGVTFEEFIQKVGLETIKYSVRRFERTTFNESLKIQTRFRTSWISTMQFCFQPWFDVNDFFEIKDQGNFFMMILSHNINNLEDVNIACMSIDFHGRPSSLSRFMEGHGRARDGFNDNLCLGIRHEVTVDVRARYVMLENDDNGTACRNIIEKGENEFDCRSRCRMEMIKINLNFRNISGINICKCTPPTLSYLVRNKNEYKEFPVCDYENCKINVENITYSEQQCTRKCYRSCDQITYDISHIQHGKMFHRNLTVINLNWGSFEYLILSQHWVWSMSTFVAALGGSMGAWLGLSILSLIQGSTYLYTFITTTIKKRHSRFKKLKMERLSNSLY